MLKLLQRTLAALSHLLIMLAPGRSLTLAAAGLSDMLRKDFDPTRSLDKFGYTFNAEGQLRSIDTNEPFNFEVKPGDKAFNQANYEALGKVLDLYVYDLLEKEGLHRLVVPKNTDRESGESTSFIFASPELASAEKLLLLIHGSGVVRAGQWSRRLIINHSLESGTQIPYIRRAKERGYGVIVLNSNQNFDVNGSGKPVRGSETPEKHFEYVWEHFVRPCCARHIAIVAHSYGGVITIHGASKFLDVARRTFAVAFTDSVHSIRYQMKKNRYDILEPWIKKNMTNWVSSSQPVGMVMSGTPFDCLRVSAGTPVHEETSWKAIDAVWEFIDKMLADALITSPHADVTCYPTSIDAASSPSQVDASDQSQNEHVGLADSSSDSDIDGSLDELSENCSESPNDCPMEHDQHTDL